MVGVNSDGDSVNEAEYERLLCSLRKGPRGANLLPYFHKFIVPAAMSLDVQREFQRAMGTPGGLSTHVLVLHERIKALTSAVDSRTREVEALRKQLAQAQGCKCRGGTSAEVPSGGLAPVADGLVQRQSAHKALKDPRPVSSSAKKPTDSDDDDANHEWTMLGETRNYT